MARGGSRALSPASVGANLALAVALLAVCGSAAAVAKEAIVPGRHVDLALVNARIVDGSGAEPIENGVILISGDRIEAVGMAAEVQVPGGVRLIDLGGRTVLPGFINAHVHRAFEPSNLRAWARAGVTTVRDEGAPGDTIEGLRDFQRRFSPDPEYARLFSAGTMFGAYGGYGSLPVNTPDQARRKVLAEIEKGVNAVKVALEDGYSGLRNLPNLTPDELAAIVETAHARGVPVSGHLTSGKHVDEMLDAGVDDVAHLPCDDVPAGAIGRLAGDGVYVIPAFTFSHNVGWPALACLGNLRRFLDAGVNVALGSDYAGDPGRYELGMPLYELLAMNAAGMTPMQVVVAATSAGAHVLKMEGDLGTLEAGKLADLLVVDGDPLADLRALSKACLVIHGGTVIRDELER